VAPPLHLWSHVADRPGEQGHGDDSGGGVSVDPICGKPVVDDDSPSMEYHHRTYFFCSDRCRDRFARRIERLRLGELAKMGALFAGPKVRWGLA